MTAAYIRDTRPQWHEFPRCCGADLLINFGNTRTGGFENFEEFSKEEISAGLKKREEEARRRRMALLVCILDANQMKAVGSCLKKAKFKQVAESYHANHDHYIYLFVKELFPKEKVTTRRKKISKMLCAKSVFSKHKSNG
jgi:hypothetical protein